jgi:hypothetical protein
MTKLTSVLIGHIKILSHCYDSFPELEMREDKFYRNSKPINVIQIGSPLKVEYSFNSHKKSIYDFPHLNSIERELTRMRHFEDERVQFYCVLKRNSIGEQNCVIIQPLGEPEDVPEEEESARIINIKDAEMNLAMQG